MNKKILIPIIVLLILLLAGLAFWFYSRDGQIQKDEEKVSQEEGPDSSESFQGSTELYSLDLIDSALNKLNLPGLNLFFSFDLGSFESGVPEINPETKVEVESPSPDISLSNSEIELDLSKFEQTPQDSGPVVDQSTCSQFSGAPSCSFVPVEHRDLCQQCKDAGY